MSIGSWARRTPGATSVTSADAALLLLATGAIAHRAMVRGPRELGRPRRQVSLGASSIARSTTARLTVCDDRPVAWALYAVGWAIGWLLLWSTRRLPGPPIATRPAVAVVVPARDEAAVAAPPARRRSCRSCDPATSSSSSTTTRPTTPPPSPRRSARAVVPAPPTCRAGWVGKPHACATGAAATTAADARVPRRRRAARARPARRPRRRRRTPPGRRRLGAAVARRRAARASGCRRWPTSSR